MLQAREHTSTAVSPLRGAAHSHFCVPVRSPEKEERARHARSSDRFQPAAMEKALLCRVLSWCVQSMKGAVGFKFCLVGIVNESACAERCSLILSGKAISIEGLAKLLLKQRFQVLKHTHQDAVYCTSRFLQYPLSVSRLQC